jgi:CubicO group peptidase (beta-lactamase class C family)
VRTGDRPPPGQPEWDNTFIPNVVLRALTQRAESTPRNPLPSPPNKALATATEATRLDSRWQTIGKQTPLTIPDWLDTTEVVRGDFRGEYPHRAPTQLGITSEAIAAAETYAEKTDSASLLIWRAGAIEYERYWGGRGPDDVSETYSMAKSVTGLAVGCAVASGAIESVDDAVARYIAEWRGTSYESVTVRELLQMTSGLHHERFDYSLGQKRDSRALQTFLGPDIESSVLAFPLEKVPGRPLTTTASTPKYY